MNNDKEEKLNLAAYKLYNDYKEFINNYNENNNSNAFMKSIEVKNDGDKYSGSEKEIILSKFVALVFENKK